MVDAQIAYDPVLNCLYCNGMRVMSSPYILPTVERRQVKFPRTKKKRIRKKWAKRNENFKNFEQDVGYVWGDVILLSPKNYAQLLEKQIKL